MSGQKSKVNIVFGAMTFGRAGTNQSRVTDLQDCAKILDIFQAHGHNEIDTSRFYCEGTSEEMLRELEYQKRGLKMDTKFYPTAGKGMGGPEYNHSPEHVRTNLLRSLEALGTKKVDMWYLHGPDRTTPYEVTMREVNKLYEEGYFERFAISNYMAWEVAEIVGICERNGWVKPSVYQGIYNAIRRTIEPELLPCLRKYKMGFYAYNPLGGGFFAGNFSKDSKVESGSRFDDKHLQGKMYRARYWNNEHFKALDLLKPVCEQHKLTMAEVALRWMTNHSQLKREFGDAILIGASSVQHIDQNLEDLEKGPLPEDVLAKLDEAWELLRGQTIKYWH